MPTEKINILDIGKGGLNRDKPPFTLSPDTWSQAYNVSMRRGLVMSGPGMVRISNCDGAQQVRHLLPVPTSSAYYWNQSGLKAAVGDMCLYGAGGSRDVTPAAGFTVQDGDQWTGGVFNSIPVLCNGRINAPHYLPDISGAGIWEPLPFTIEDGSVTESWVDRSISASVLRTFKNFLFALDISRDAGRYPHMLMWSDAADPGNVPQWQNWTSIDPANLGGEVSLSETGGFLVDAVPLGDLLMIYKEDSIWSASFIEGEYVFKFRKAIGEIGALAPNCIAPFKGGHVVFGDGDIVLHNGTTAKSIIADRMRRTLFRQIDSDNFQNSFVVVDEEHQEVWCCFPSQGNTYPDAAAVWNWRHDTWTGQILPKPTFWITEGVDNFSETLEPDSWGAGEGEIDVDGSPIDPVDYTPAQWGGGGVPNPYPNKAWGERSFNPTLQQMVGTDGEVYRVDHNVTTRFGEPITQYAERSGIPLLEHDRYGILRRIYPQLKADGPVDFYVGQQDNPTDTVTWEGPISFDPNTDSFFNCLRSGRLFAIKVQSDTGVSFELFGFKAEITPTGLT